MKFAIILLAVMPFVLSTEVDKRGILDFLGIHGPLIDLNQIKTIIQGILDKIGSDASEQVCELACHEFLAADEGNLIHTLCTPLCRSFQTVVQLFHLVPRAGSPGSEI